MKYYKNYLLYLVILISLSANSAAESFSDPNIIVTSSEAYMEPNIAIWGVSQEKGRYICYCAAASVILQSAAGLQKEYWNEIGQVTGISCTDTAKGGLIYDPYNPMGNTRAIDCIIHTIAKTDPLIYMRTSSQLKTKGHQYYSDTLTSYSLTEGTPSLWTIRDNIISGKPIVMGLNKKNVKRGHAVVCFGYIDFDVRNDIVKVFDGNETNHPQMVRYVKEKDLNNYTHQDCLYQSLTFDSYVFKPVGIEDHISLSGPINLPHPAGNQFYTCSFSDHPPSSSPGEWNWELYFFHENGTYLADSETRNELQLTWTAEVGTLPAGYNWERDSVGRVRGEVKVTTIDSDGISHYFVQQITYAAPAPPQPPQAIAPHNVQLPGTSALFQWTGVTGASSYRLQITRNQFSLSDTTIELPNTTTSHNVSGLRFNEEYRWRVGAKNDWGTTWSDARIFTTLPRPGTPTLNTPSNGALDLSRYPTFSWNAASNATSYRIYLKKGRYTFVNDTSEIITATTYTLPLDRSLDNGSVYTWYIGADNAAGVTYSEWRGFQTVKPAPVLAIPTNGVSACPVNSRLIWFGVVSANSYRVQVARDQGFTNIIKDTTISAASTDITPVNLSYSTQYYWRVYASFQTGISAWSQPFALRTEANPQKVPASNHTALAFIIVIISLTGGLIISGRKKHIVTK